VSVLSRDPQCRNDDGNNSDSRIIGDETIFSRAAVWDAISLLSGDKAILTAE